MLKKFILPTIIILAALAVSLFVIRPDFSRLLQRPAAEPQGGGQAALGKAYINEKGEKWGPLPEGRQEYTIASAADIYPRFASAVIDPLKVSPGNTQFMRVVVQDDAEVTSVVAEIETDNDTVKVPLKLVSVDALARAELLNQKYLVIDGKLVINNDKERLISQYPNIPISIAEAADLRKFTFEGSWVVRDTHVRTYHTTFRAKDALGRENSITMAWSDPCPGTSDADSTLTAACTIGTNTTDGVDNGNLTLQANLTLLGSGSVFAWNSGKTITIASGGSITVGSGSRLVQANLCSYDADKDGYASLANTTSTTGSCPANYVRRYTLLNGVDCYDALPTSTTRSHLAYPGQTSYFTTARGDGSFDYNCDSVETKQDTTISTLSCPDAGTCQFSCSAPGGVDGWVTSVPNCGESGSFTSGCGNYMGLICGGVELECPSLSSGPRTQACL